MKEEIEQRLAECGLTMHPDKTKIIYAGISDDKEAIHRCSSTFSATVSSRGKPKPSGATFSWASFLRSAPKLPRRSATPSGVGVHTPMDAALDRGTCRNVQSGPSGVDRLYGQFYKSKLASVLRQFDYALRRWARRKFKRLKAGQTLAGAWLRRVAQQKPDLFAHWAIAEWPNDRSDMNREIHYGRRLPQARRGGCCLLQRALRA
jgi:RNA-directed DNA polymerase